MACIGVDVDLDLVVVVGAACMGHHVGAGLADCQRYVRDTAWVDTELLHAGAQYVPDQRHGLDVGRQAQGVQDLHDDLEGGVVAGRPATRLRCTHR